MPVVKAYYDGTTFFPIETLRIPIGKVVNLTIIEEDVQNPEIIKKLAQLACINNNLEKLNETEPLPAEFDDILSQRVNFSRTLEL
ncbi:MAG: hypothetical protein FWD24_05125 [Treponema sp.]|nr:hypothetical protein [Treponema sp.]